MHKSAMALAVAGALAAPAAMAQVQIGGGIHFQYYQHDSGRDAFEKTDVMKTSEPEIYIRGEEKLGGGMSVWFQCTSSFEVLGPQADAWCGRNSAIGFRGDFGNIFFGNWDTPHKLVSNLARGWWGGTNTLQGGTLQILANGSATEGNSYGSGASFFRRHSRSINYHSPDWGGFNLQGATSSANEATGFTSAQDLAPRLFSLGGQFRTGPFFAGLGYEAHEDFGGVQRKDKSMNAAVGFTIAGAVRLSLLYMTVEYKPTVGAATEHDGLAVYLDWTLSGPHKLYVQYGMRNEIEVGGAEVANSGAEVIGAAYGYSLSKRTQLYVAANQMENDGAGCLTAAFAATPCTLGTSAGTAGGKQKVFGVGMRHSF